MKFLFSFTLLLLIFCFKCTAETQDLPTCPPFGIITIPKTGTHLIMKCLGMLQKRTNLCIRKELNLKEFNRFNYLDNLESYLHQIERLIDDHHYLDDHSHVSKLVGHYMDRHPEMPWIIGVRDLRDTIVSQAFFVWNKLEAFLGPTTVQQKISFLLEFDLNTRSRVVNTPIMYFQAKNVLSIKDKKNALLVRFEDLVGSKGGGNDDLQRKTIKQIASHIGVDVSEDQLDFVQENLFGTEVRVESMSEETFRSGKIGSWKEVFRPEHVNFFNKHYKKFQREFGYLD